MGESAATALVFADRLGRELEPLFQDCGPALLPLAQKTPLHFCLDDLAEAGVRHAIVVVSHAADQVQSLLAGGEPWGMQVECVLSRGEEEPAVLLQRFASLLAPRFIAIRADVLRTPIVKELQAACANGETAVASLDGRSMGVAFTDGRDDEMAALIWPAPKWSGVNMAGHRCSYLESLQDVLEANLDLAGGRYAGLLPAGLKLQEGVMLGRLSHLDPASVSDPPISLGDHSSVHQSVKLYGPVVIGENCFIDRDTQIRDSLILPNTYIGAGLDVKDAIVGEGLLIQPRESLTLPIDDPLWVAPMARRWRGSGTSLADRLLALMLIVISLPLWPLAALLAVMDQGQPVLRRRPVMGNRRDLRGQRHEFAMLEFAVRQPLLRGLPGLFAVLGGHLRLFGARPAPLSYAQHMPVQLDAPPAGLIRPSALELEADAPEEEIELFEVCFAAERSLKRELRCWWLSLRALLSWRAWRGEAAPLEQG